MEKNVFGGRVVVEGSSIGIANLQVMIKEFAAGTVNERKKEGRVESRITDSSGAFTFLFDGADDWVGGSTDRRPQLQLLILAPETPGSDFAGRILYANDAIGNAAGRKEHLIQLPGQLLKDRGVTQPIDPVVAREPVSTVMNKVAEAAAWRDTLATEARELFSTRLEKSRTRSKQTRSIVERRLTEVLSGITAEEAKKLNIVPAGDRPETTVWASAEKRIKTLNRRQAQPGYLVLTEDQARPFRSGEAWRNNVPASEIEPYLFRSDGSEGRPTSLVRSDPVEAMCRLASKSTPVTQPYEAGGTSTSPAGDGIDDDNSGLSESATELTIEDLPQLVHRVVGAMKPPLEPDMVGGERPTATTIQSALSDLKIPSGPADVTAFHDYQNLQIAFEHVWQQLLSDDVLEIGKALAERIQDAGGDVLSAIEAGDDPILTMKEEIGVIAKTNSDDPFDKKLPSWVSDLGPVIGPYDPMDDLPPGTGGGGGGGNGTGGGKGGGHGHGAVVGNPPTKVDPGRSSPHELLGELEDMLNEQYKFDVFAPGSTNFGLLVTYRQKWEPVTYQAGDLVSTLTLTPKETRKVATKRVVKRDRSVKETEANLRNRTDETKSTMRIDAEVVDRASTKTNFNHNSKGSFNIGYASGDATTTFDRTAEAASQETKKSFHENVMNAAMQLRSERSWSIETKDVFEDESTNTSEISNPNDELTVTYLFYELERRYRLTEHLHHLTPVVLVAMEVPNPGRKAIDRVLLVNSWIINRVILDDRYRAPLEYLCNKIVGDELGLFQMGQNVSEIRAAVAQLKQMHRNMEADIKAREWELNRAVKTRAAKIAGNSSEGVLESAFEWVTGQGDEEDIESARILEDMYKENYEKAVRQEKDLRMRLDAETSTLNAASQAYAKAYAEHMNRRMEVAGLRAHFKENILYYMQAIWSFTFPDQLFFQLYKVKAPKIEAPGRTYALSEPGEIPLSVHAPPGSIVLEVTPSPGMQAPVSVTEDAVTLAEIADLDRPLGFKGNYIIFPLKVSNPLTDLMMTPYIDSELGLRDPDELGGWSPEDFAEYARCLVKAHRENGMSEADLKKLEDKLEDQYRKIVSSPYRVSDEIVVPTESLFIEALPGEHALLENFKLEHRQLDVEKAREEARKLKLESLRYAARILTERYEDPEIDRKTLITGQAGIVVPPE
ncbi:hypothetical protein [Sinorhizobium meliloti]|uniref:hypothetical protein n=1 Tax=Rhizobium meliloti TaxID=382 RepID=UPI002090FF2E|nr:hypothetical protein [Sinorhizobium meliloti]MCO5963688.1 hypothetical protein [Sinorhizobium meliloti]